MTDAAEKASAAEQAVFKQWSEQKIAQWNDEPNGKLRTKFPTLQELQAWLRRKGRQTLLVTKRQRETKFRSNDDELQTNTASKSIVVKLIIIALVCTALATFVSIASLGRSQTPNELVRRSERK